MGYGDGRRGWAALALLHCAVAVAVVVAFAAEAEADGMMVMSHWSERRVPPCY